MCQCLSRSISKKEWTNSCRNSACLVSIASESHHGLGETLGCTTMSHRSLNYHNHQEWKYSVQYHCGLAESRIDFMGCFLVHTLLRLREVQHYRLLVPVLWCLQRQLHIVSPLQTRRRTQSLRRSYSICQTRQLYHTPQVLKLSLTHNRWSCPCLLTSSFSCA